MKNINYGRAYVKCLDLTPCMCHACVPKQRLAPESIRASTFMVFALAAIVMGMIGINSYLIGACDIASDLYLYRILRKF